MSTSVFAITKTKPANDKEFVGVRNTRQKAVSVAVDIVEERTENTDHFYEFESALTDEFETTIHLYTGSRQLIETYHIFKYRD